MILDVHYPSDQTDPAGDDDKRVAALGPPLVPQDRVGDDERGHGAQEVPRLAPPGLKHGDVGDRHRPEHGQAYHAGGRMAGGVCLSFRLNNPPIPSLTYQANASPMTRSSAPK
jgi:hypothetical protein